MDKFKKINDEVYYFNNTYKFITNEDINFIKQRAKENSSQKCRLCTHDNENELFQEMFIVHTNSYFVRPHFHKDKSESLHVIEGEADLYIFNKNGDIIDKKKLGNESSKNIYYYRINKEIIHTLVINSDYFVFKETTTGPFKKNLMIFPEWSPEKKNKEFTNLLSTFI